MTSMGPPARWHLLLLVVVLAGGAALSYLAWLGWDQQYDIDPVTGDVSGPYQPWQVVGCVATLAALTGGAGWLRRPGLAVAVVPLVFTCMLARDAARIDDSGLWAVGALAVAIVSLSGAAAVAYLGDGLRRRRERTGSRAVP